jgi:hypothetical protein
MKLMLGRRRMRRLVGVLVLTGLTVMFAAPVPALAVRPSHDCHHPASTPTARLADGGAAPGCDHGAGAPCAAMLDCTGAVSALAGAPVRPALQAPGVAANWAAAQALHGRLALGPPPPPPNS